MKRLMGFVGIIAVSCFLGWAMLVLVYMLPTDAVARHMPASAQLIISEGYYPAWFDDAGAIRMQSGNAKDIRTILFNNRITVRDNFTDAFMIVNAAYEGPETVVERSLNVFSCTLVGAYGPMDVLDEYYLNGKADNLTSVEYGRYWHGYLILLKPLLSIMDLRGIRIFNFVIIIFLMVFLLCKIIKSLGKRVAIIFGISLLFYMPFTVPLCMQFCTMSYITIAALLVLIYRYEYIQKRNLWGYYFLIVGIVTSYIDFLTYPLISFGLPLLFLLYMDSNDEIGLLKIIRYGIDWSIGYVGMWGSKWILASVITGNNIISDALDQISHRAAAQTDDGRALNIFQVWSSNLCNYVNIVYGFLIIVVLLLVIKAFWDSRDLLKKTKRFEWKYIAVAFTPFIWYAAFQNHSYAHGYFTFRALVVTVFAMMLFVEKSTCDKESCV